ncbi:MAG: S-methyl-5'-thioadenosine phosphorylase [Archangium sp.]|nr:S-methyl-5'-thioadenosine phosphorylase [Archangium sp.]MDP3572103.1 S-methyl-5'-thioadenosine phosphorylase [Archangium sp.]
MAFRRVGIIGGSGLGQALGQLTHGKEHSVDTPFGTPSGPVVTGELGGVPIALLPRHGPGHVHSPTHVPYRANLFALKTLGVTHLLCSTAVGSLREEIAPRDLVVPDQLIDKTFRRESTFFDEFAVHAELANPFCSTLRGILLECARTTKAKVHDGGTLVVMEGPQFSTRAESELHRSWGAHLIGMTAMPEAKLAREAEFCCAYLSLPTDYDCWRPHPAKLDQHELLKEIVGNLEAATALALETLRKAVALVAERGTGDCSCQHALDLGVWTDKSKISAETRAKLAPLIGRLF